ncbi:MAG: EndoU domain-containing protein [Selenomonas sp.]|nr:EndoU domain-containing protein [Selenomonas sp.]
MKGKCTKLLLALIAALLLALVAGCGGGQEASGSGTASVAAQAQQGEAGHKAQGGKTSGKQDSAEAGKSAASKKGSYTMQDIRKLKHTEIFAKGALEHIFDGTINKKGKATGYHYDKVEGSKGEIISGTRSKEDKHGVYTAKVKVEGVQKNGFSSFYPDDWTPQEVVDAINAAYEDALGNTDNPQGDLWIGYSGDLEIDMYLTEQKKIITAYPIYRKE